MPDPGPTSGPSPPQPPREPPPPPPGNGHQPPRDSSISDVAVGAFVLVLLALGVASVLFLGQRNRVFEQRAVLHAGFTDVQGLQAGAPVRLSGVNVGTVSRVAFPRSRADRRVLVDIQVTRDALARIGQDSIARIGTQGLLGDKTIEISVATSTSPSLRPGDSIDTVAPTDLNLIVERAAVTVDRIRVVADKAAETLTAFAEPRTLANLQGTIASLRQILAAAESGRGLVHALFYDPHQARVLRATLDNLEQLTRDLDASAHGLDKILAPAKADGAHLIGDVARAARNVGDAAEALHRSQVIQNLDHASADVAALTASTRAGQGTLGALLLDPTIYEQLVTVLGGIQRSRILRALVRFAIARDVDEPPPPAVDEPTSSHPPARRPRPPAPSPPVTGPGSVPGPVPR